MFGKREYLLAAGIAIVYGALLAIVVLVQPAKYYVDQRRPHAYGDVMASQFPGRCADIARKYLGPPNRGRVTLGVLPYNDMVRQLQRCVAQVQATGVPK